LAGDSAGEVSSDPGAVSVGSRLYYLEIPSAAPRTAPPVPGAKRRPTRSSTVRIVLDFIKRDVRVALFYGEARAQQLVRRLRQGLPVSAVISLLKERHERALLEAAAGHRGSTIRVLH